MSLTFFFTFILLGQWLAKAQAQNCPSWIRTSPECNRGGAGQGTGAQRPYWDWPTSQYQNGCICSSVYYSLVEACVTCRRDHQIVDFYQWLYNCDRRWTRNGSIDYSEEIGPVR
ncbi:hypothetical protein FA15DRAFT_197033 [Coprinopsis marcescibilis]|uniref:Secreted protein n=1 Tax=Coprinopsis marcescibilis TaxID=230819 RepID=A0A5C3LB48_COPMA|nr:hypothetical protein FA15DRAFT_197033 [Coprinopsis marcescibilis]